MAIAISPSARPKVANLLDRGRLLPDAHALTGLPMSSVWRLNRSPGSPRTAAFPARDNRRTKDKCGVLRFQPVAPAIGFLANRMRGIGAMRLVAMSAVLALLSIIPAVRPSRSA